LPFSVGSLGVLWERKRRRKRAEEGSMTSSAAAFVEGGVQDACDDACSICLESFCDDDPATVLAPLFPRDPFLSVSLFGGVVVCTRYWNLLLDFILFSSPVFPSRDLLLSIYEVCEELDSLSTCVSARCGSPGSLETQYLGFRIFLPEEINL
jgi:hypothetical protein